MNFRLSAVLMLLLLLGGRSSHGFALNGANAAYQTAAFLYDGGGAPQNIGEEYRWNIPVLTYGFDSAFINYFGTNGVRAIEAAFRQINDLPAVSLVTDQVLTNNFPFNTQGINPTAASVLMTDIRSQMLTFLAGYMGLSEAERFTWCIRNRWIGPGGAPTNYVVISRNFDPITRIPTDTVNGRRLGYVVLDGLIAPSDCDAIEVDATGFTALSTTVADFATLTFGGSFSSLTYDDVGGIRYLYATNNFNTENLLPGVGVTSTAASSSSPWLPVGTNVQAVIGGTAVDVGVRGGIDKVTFVRVDFDSLLGIGYSGVTNTWTDSYITNNTVQAQTLARPILRPDIIISAGDLGLGGNLPIFTSIVVNNFINNDGINGLAGQNGPGLLTVPFQLQVDFTTMLPFYVHTFPFAIDGPPLPGSTQDSGIWGYFDDTAIYQIFPDYLNLQLADLERMVIEARSTIE